MSKIQKVAVTDARLIQDEPAYAVQKGALSISVAPFQAISASSSQMTFQVLVPSLNVFIDRKIQLSTPLSYNAQLFYGGARGTGYKQIYTGTFNALSANATSLTTTAFFQAGAIVTKSTMDATLVAFILAAYQNGQPALLFGSGFAPNTFVTSATSSNDSIIILNFSPPLAAASAGEGFTMCFPTNFDVPDVSMSQFTAGISIGADNGMALQTGGIAGSQSGWCSAVSGKDLAWTQFPVQSSLVNMTATLNDCTVTTNGDTLREQLMLTSTQENLKQRTTPTNADTFAWGRDDVQNNSGNFSTYSVTNNFGDIPNGSWPSVWSSNATCSTTLTSASGYAPTSGTAAQWPFLAAGKAYAFVPSTVQGGEAGKGGIGFYIATASTSVKLPAGFTSGQNVLVPFFNYQPVWTTNFPGGDLYGAASGANGGGTANAFTVNGTTLTLNVAVPPMCMLGARLYDALAGNYSVAAPPQSAANTVNTSANGCFAIVTGLIAGTVTGGVARGYGGLGQIGSQYQLTFTQTLAGVTTLVAPASGPQSIYALQGGCPVQLPLPVYGTISVTEPMVISPLIWADSAEFQTVGLYGMTNMQFVMNFSTLGTTRAVASTAVVLSGALAKANATMPYWLDDLTQPNPNTGNVLRSSNVRSVLSDLTFASTGNSNGPWYGGDNTILTTAANAPTLFTTFLTPGVDVQLPDVSTVPYVEFPRYFYSTGITSIATGDNTVLSQTISLTSIPDMVMVYVKPATRGPSQLDQYIPINRVSVTFDNFSNLCSSFQQVHLYECAVAAGLDMDWQQWRGFTQAQYPSGVLGPCNFDTNPPYAYTGQSQYTQTSGGPILLRMGQDITLQPGLAPGCLGNYSFQIQVTLDNRRGYFSYTPSTASPVITIIAINSGFFETMRGQSAIRKTILSMADVAAATSDSGVSKTHLNRMVGRGHYMSGGSSMLHRGLSWMKKAHEVNARHGLTNLARTYGGEAGSRIADMAESAMSHGAAAHDSLYGGGKRHRGSGL